MKKNHQLISKYLRVFIFLFWYVEITLKLDKNNNIDKRIYKV